ncbi:MAG: alpha/beta fold hydrolase [Solirubrobacterales bacterium]
MMNNSNLLDIDGLILNYYEKGQGDSLIFLHGNSMNSKSLYNLYNYFSKRYKVIAIDSRGHGLSQCGEVPYSISLFADDVITFCNKKSLSNICIIGYSDGANIGLMIAKKCPQLIHKLVLISGNYKVNGIKKWFREIIKFSIILLRPFTKYFKKVKIQKWKLDLMLNDMFISEIDLNQIFKPTLVLAAENDLIYEKHTFEIQRNIYGSRLEIIKNTNHFNIISNMESVSIIDEFLN